MRKMSFAQAIEDVIAQEMAADPRIVILGEDVHAVRLNLFARFGSGRVRATPISEGGFLGAAVAAAMAGLRPIAEIMLVDFIGVGVDALLNHAAKVNAFSGEQWHVPIVVRTACGGGYGDGGQHEQALWGWLAHIPGLSVAVPSNPADAGALMLSSLRANSPIVFMEHKLLTEPWLDYLGTGGRRNVSFDTPDRGTHGSVPKRWDPMPFGQAAWHGGGGDLCIVSIGHAVHLALNAAEILSARGATPLVLDLRTVSPLDTESIRKAATVTDRVLVVDEDYERFGLSGEIAACLLEGGLRPRYARVCTQGTIPYALQDAAEALPNVRRIVDASLALLER